MRALRLLPLLGLTAAAAACSSTGTSNAGNVGLNFATNTPTAASVVGAGATANAVAGSETYTDGTNTLVLNSVSVVLRKIELKLANAPATCPDDENRTDGGAVSGDDCEEIKVAPQVFSLPLGGSTPERVLSVQVPAGTYREVEFKVHKPGDKAVDQAFLAQNPEFNGQSVKITGTWNGTPFTLYLDPEAEYESNLVPPLTVADGVPVDFTINVDLSTWFKNGSSLVNPSSAAKGQVNYGIVVENIKRSFKAFEDNDRDGYDD